MKIVFFGTPEEASPILEKLIRSEHTVIAVVTQPDRPKGRGLKLEEPPVKRTARKHGLQAFQPEKLSRDDFDKTLASLEPDICVVVAYGLLISKKMLDIPKFGFVNIHASLLPKYRGAAPIQWALMNGEKKTGVTIFKLEEGLDDGDILGQKEIAIENSDCAETLSKKIFEAGKDLLMEALQKIEEGSASYKKQDHERATLAPKITKELGAINWKDPGRSIFNKVRALNPGPSTSTYYNKKLLKITRISPESFSPSSRSTSPGTIVEIIKNVGFAVQAGDHTLLVTQVQPESGKKMSAWDFILGHKVRVGDVLPS